ncbi:MAG TPA: hypothetical protein VFW06_08475 [Acidimicrobiia bacterium]|nr:hypothetical protein [Acidimicrobiia bacterium]
MLKRLMGDLIGLAVMLVVFLIVTFPATWLLMLFLGNVHVNTSYWGTLPLGVIVSLLISSGTTGASRRHSEL